MKTSAVSSSPTSSVAPAGNRLSYRDQSPRAAHHRDAPHAHHRSDAFELRPVETPSHDDAVNARVAQLEALVPRVDELEAKQPVVNGPPSKFYQNVADGMWYVGHVISMGSLLSQKCFPAAATMVILGQVLTIASRPVGRMRERVRGVSDDTA